MPLKNQMPDCDKSIQVSSILLLVHLYERMAVIFDSLSAFTNTANFLFFVASWCP